MKDAPDIAAADSSEREANANLNAYIVYEDVLTGKKAKGTCDVLAERLGPGWSIDIKMASFKALSAPRLRRMAAATAAKAHLVIFSCHDRPLPREVSKWVERCLIRPVRPAALVAIVTCAPPPIASQPAVETYLSGLARQRGLQFFSHQHSLEAETLADRLTTFTP
jgi:hypothetical protein